MKKAKIEKLIRKYQDAMIQHERIANILEDEISELESAIDYHENQSIFLDNEIDRLMMKLE